MSEKKTVEKAKETTTTTTKETEKEKEQVKEKKEEKKEEKDDVVSECHRIRYFLNKAKCLNDMDSRSVVTLVDPFEAVVAQLKKYASSYAWDGEETRTWTSPSHLTISAAQIAIGSWINNVMSLGLNSWTLVQAVQALQSKASSMQ
eukprot:TRINITY_DN9160_c0_g1_i1.p1 TRINITY_DN9160_c0_g1~~TRINITY_DN9160_c0_g1_i1.p1  ORF type:complete len:146 (+),score=59.76 TRINITY_DN9160_c0_g1_i1:43-480(+)